MDNYNKLFMIIRKTDLLNFDEKQELQLYLMNLQEQVDKKKEVIDKAIEYIEKFIPIDEDTILMRERQRDYLLDILKGE